MFLYVHRYCDTRVTQTHFSHRADNHSVDKVQDSTQNPLWGIGSRFLYLPLVSNINFSFPVSLKLFETIGRSFDFRDHNVEDGKGRVVGLGVPNLSVFQGPTTAHYGMSWNKMTKVEVIVHLSTFEILTLVSTPNDQAKLSNLLDHAPIPFDSQAFSLVSLYSLGTCLNRAHLTRYLTVHGGRLFPLDNAPLSVMNTTHLRPHPATRWSRSSFLTYYIMLPTRSKGTYLGTLVSLYDLGTRVCQCHQTSIGTASSS
jgi:hypothetical protein